MANDRNNLQTCAMYYGTGMGLLWVFKFMLFPIGLRAPVALWFFLVLTLGVPLLGYWLARKFRDKHCGGVISFSRAFLFVALLYLFASMLTAAFHYAYFRFIDGGFIADTYRSLWGQMKEMYGTALPSYTRQYDEVIDLFSNMNPLEVTFQMLSNNLFAGILMAVPTALMVMRRKKKD